jgi:ribonuclease I
MFALLCIQKKRQPVVHGLWPEVGNYGTSECLAPAASAAPTVVYSCYDQVGTSEADCLSFEQHEWSAHGVCAGANDAADFFTQLCSLAVAPLAVMNATRNNGGDLNAMASALASAGYAIFDVDSSSNSQVHARLAARLCFFLF